MIYQLLCSLACNPILRTVKRNPRNRPHTNNQKSDLSLNSRPSSRFGPPQRTENRILVENLSSRISWQVCIVYTICCWTLQLQVNLATTHSHKRFSFTACSLLNPFRYSLSLTLSLYFNFDKFSKELGAFLFVVMNNLMNRHVIFSTDRQTTILRLRSIEIFSLFAFCLSESYVG